MHSELCVKILWLWLQLITIHQQMSLALDNKGFYPTCNLKDNCNFYDNLLTVSGSDVTLNDHHEKNRRFFKEITSIFEDKVNYSLQLFALDESILDYNDTIHTNNINSVEKTRPKNLTSVTILKDRVSENQTKGNLTTKQFDDLEEKERVYLHNIGQRFFSLSQPFNAAQNPLASDACRIDIQHFFEALKNFDLWALQMYDSTAKLSSGLLNGNINQPGDFDQCLRIEHKRDDSTNKILRGQYCLAYIQPSLPHKSKRLQTFFELMQSHSPFQSEFNDPGHRVPRYSLINWGICVPDSCSYSDVEYTIRYYLANVTATTGIDFQVRVEPKMCQVANRGIAWDRGTTWAVRFFVVIIAITILSTFYEFNCKAVEPNPWLIAFSLRKNFIWLFSTKSTPDDIKTVHGIRFLNAIMLLLSHKSMAVFFNPYNNRTEMSESLGRSWTVIGRAASLYTDPFLLFSGMLTAYSLFGRLFKGQPIRLKNEYISRLIRIVPPLAALILFCTYILPLWGSGPQWNLVVGHHADICKKNWWRNLLFIHNYFGFSEMCLTHTHHLGIDTELFAVAPLMILALWKWPRKGLYALLALAALGTGARYYTTVVNELSNYVYFGTNIQRLFRTADFMYSFPPYRSTVYIMGILLGYALRKFKGIKMTNGQVRVGWIVAVACVLLSLVVPAPMGRVGYQYNSTHAAIYAAFAPIAWCSFFAWVVFVSHNGHSNKLINYFSWKGFQVTTKLSYAIYLTQFPVFFYNVGRRRHIDHYYSFLTIFLDTNEFIAIFLASIALTLFFDAPFQNIKSLIFKRPAASTQITNPGKTMLSNKCPTSGLTSNDENKPIETAMTSTTTKSTTCELEQLH